MSYKTYQDLVAIGNDENERIDFVKQCVQAHKTQPTYKDAETAEQYFKHENVTIKEYQRILYTLTGKAVPDRWGANYKMACRHFYRFITQEAQYLLGNGVSWNNDTTADKLGTKEYTFDSQLVQAGTKALIHGVCFGFFNLDHLEVFSFLEFAPLYDEENGSLRAGIRFWQISPDKPFRATLFEEDGYTDYIWVKDEGKILHPKRTYKSLRINSVVDGEQIYNFENYPAFPIVPLWGNLEHQSEMIGLREQIDCFDLIKSGFANTVDEASIVYWTIQNAGGMDDVDLAQFVERMKTVHAATVDDQAQAQSHSQDAPYTSRVALLDRLDRDLYRDAMALDTDNIVAGATTATQIKAAYEPLNNKTDGFEYQVTGFINKILALVGIDDVPTYTRSVIINTTEAITNVTASAQHLSTEYVTSKILELLGDGDKKDEVLRQMNEEATERLAETLATVPVSEGDMV